MLMQQEQMPFVQIVEMSWNIQTSFLTYNLKKTLMADLRPLEPLSLLIPKAEAPSIPGELEAEVLDIFKEDWSENLVKLRLKMQDEKLRL